MNINSFQDNNNQGQEMSLGDKAKALWSTIPLFVRFVIISTVSCYMLSWIFTSFLLLFTNQPLYSLGSLQVWRFVTSVLVTLSIFNILFAFISWVPDAMRLENTSGTVRYMVNFFVNATLINILYAVVAYIISIFLSKSASTTFLTNPSAGLWPLIMAEITMLCLANPDNQVMLFFIPYQFSARYYPWALFGFFTLLNFNIQFDLLAGIGYGYVFFYYLREKMQFTDNFVTKCENFVLFKYLSTFTGYVPLQISNVNNSFTGYNHNQQNNNNNNNNNNTNVTVEEPKQHPVTTPFKGKGTALGSNENESRIPGHSDNYRSIGNTNNINTSVERLDISDNKTKQPGNKYHDLQEEI